MFDGFSTGKVCVFAGSHRNCVCVLFVFKHRPHHGGLSSFLLPITAHPIRTAQSKQSITRNITTTQSANNINTRHTQKDLFCFSQPLVDGFLFLRFVCLFLLFAAQPKTHMTTKQSKNVEQTRITTNRVCWDTCANEQTLETNAKRTRTYRVAMYAPVLDNKSSNRCTHVKPQQTNKAFSLVLRCVRLCACDRQTAPTPVFPLLPCCFVLHMSRFCRAWVWFCHSVADHAI